ncbi:MAG: hypothetical protein KGJ86_05440 [Chloroflexota bacterium]|nr:hypothetical protein [Chloroflexota bacterium]
MAATRPSPERLAGVSSASRSALDDLAQRLEAYEGAEQHLLQAYARAACALGDDGSHRILEQLAAHSRRHHCLIAGFLAGLASPPTPAAEPRRVVLGHDEMASYGLHPQDHALLLRCHNRTANGSPVHRDPSLNALAVTDV